MRLLLIFGVVRQSRADSVLVNEDKSIYRMFIHSILDVLTSCILISLSHRSGRSTYFGKFTNSSIKKMSACVFV